MHRVRLMMTSLVLFALVLIAVPARAETINCTPINAVPAVITVPGVYCLTKSLVTNMTTGKAIDIQANNVVLDMNGFRLGGLGAGLGTAAIGIYAFNRQNIAIRNGTVRGFLRGIYLDDAGTGSQGHVVEDIRADQNTWIGIDVQGNGSIVRNNQVVATGGSTTFGPNADAIGIVLFRSGVRVIDNDVMDTVKQGTGTAIGIVFGVGADDLAVNNRITAADIGILFNGSTGKYRDNLTSGVTTPYNGGTDAGGNN